jgi:hypothetical protein
VRLNVVLAALCEKNPSIDFRWRYDVTFADEPLFGKFWPEPALSEKEKELVVEKRSCFDDDFGKEGIRARSQARVM